MIICFDTETTGLGDDDEIIQLSIADAETGTELLNEYFRPSDELMERGWEEAAAVTGIYPQDVEEKHKITDPEVFSDIQHIFDMADIVICYHVAYDVKMMERAGFNMSTYQYQDPMYSFAAYWWSTHPDEMHTSKSGKVMNPFMGWRMNGLGHHGAYISKNLTFAAGFFGTTDFGAHDSMNDVRATIDVWRGMNDIDASMIDYETFRPGEVVELDKDGNPVWLAQNEHGEFVPILNGHGRTMTNFVHTYTREGLIEADES